MHGLAAAATVNEANTNFSIHLSFLFLSRSNTSIFDCHLIGFYWPFSYNLFCFISFSHEKRVFSYSVLWTKEKCTDLILDFCFLLLFSSLFFFFFRTREKYIENAVRPAQIPLTIINHQNEKRIRCIHFIDFYLL